MTRSRRSRSNAPTRRNACPATDAREHRGRARPRHALGRAVDRLLGRVRGRVPRPARAQHFTPPNTPPGGAPSIAYGGGCWDLGAGRGAGHRARRARRALLELVDPPAALVRLRRVGPAADELQREPGPRRQRRQGARGRCRTAIPGSRTGSTPRAGRSGWPSTGTSAPTRNRCRPRASCTSMRCGDAVPPDHPTVTPAQRQASSPDATAPRSGAGAEGRRVPWTPPPPPEWRDRLNAHGPAVGGAEHLVSLDPDELLATARASHRARRLRRRHLAAALRRAGRRAPHRSGPHRRRPDRRPHRPAAGAAPTAAPRSRLGGRPERSSTSRSSAGVRRRHRSFGHVDPARAARARPGEPDARDVGAAVPGRGRRGRRARRDRAPTRPRACTRSGPTCNPRTSRCTTTTATSRTSASSSRCSSSSPISGAAPTTSRATRRTWSRADHTDAYRYHRKVLQTLQRSVSDAARDAVGAQGAEPSEPAPHAVRGLPRRPGRSSSTAIRSRRCRRRSA